MDKDKIIALIEQELVQADEAGSETDFQKHMYAIHTLTALYTDSAPASQYKQSRPIAQQYTSNQTAGASMSSTTSTAQTKVSAAEIEAMGGKVNTSNTSTPPGNSNKMVTDDELGNGDSIFDF
ncbi:Uncharacterised protein [Staphylococcus piscifermentans]|uniref:YwdI family protein n=1 Tax=Staphylococcus piscifermentans TaxID=70258 RepID=A0A239UG26_9STAP|nr:DUF5327 family protein [Staphylococcus piscifermentans]RTX85633.1 hypothetical protein CD139_03385 [Staphylococcus piscifermentans]GEP85655.1 hypothetical protein SPI02_22400 [Staphylococcus piscifermentans]SNV08826.1 Uncharacterised protein [Staphylococcus piscifermentans]